MTSRLRVVEIFPDLLGTYGDRGNALVLAQRSRWRGLGCELLSVEAGEPVPSSADIYLIGGGEDVAQVAAVEHIRAQPGVQRAVDRGAAVLAVCAGIQVLGTTFTIADGTTHGGVGLLDTTSSPMRQRAIGELAVTSDPRWGMGRLTGFENHRGHTRVGPAAAPLGSVTRGIGNGDQSEGVVQGRIIGTYMHGPVLARNPALADVLIGWATGTTIRPLVIPEIDTLRAERFQAARR